MIIDCLDNIGFYNALHPRFKNVFEFIRSTDLTSLSVGRHDIQGDELFATIMESNLREPLDAPLEVHDKYIDIQIVLENRETYGWTPRGGCTSPRGPMDSEKDIRFFDDPHALRFTLEAGNFCIFFPADGHAPMIGDPDITVRKCVVKVLL